MDMTRIGTCIADARKRAGFTQEELAESCGVSVQAVSKWENGHNLPDIENLMHIAELTNTTYSMLLGRDISGEDAGLLNIRNRLFRENNMFTRLRSVAAGEGLEETYKALQFMRQQHAGQFRKRSKYSVEKVLYINHPLLMACQAHACGIRDDVLLASILLHDVVEDTGITAEELPFSEEVREIVRLVSFSVPEGMTKKQAKEAYYAGIAKNPKACVVKLIDRCNNVSTMAGSFTRRKMLQYIRETEQYVLPLADVLKNQYPLYSDQAFIAKYHILSVIETIKYMLAD